MSSLNFNCDKMTEDSRIGVMIADDQAIIREGLSYLLSGYQDIKVLCEASNGLDAVKMLEHYSPDVILMDIRMPEMNGVEATKIIKEKYSNIKIVIFTTFDDDEFIIDAMTYGASGYLLKDTDSKTLVQAIKNVYAGNIIMPGAVFRKLTGNLNKKNSGEPESKEQTYNSDEFTQRETDIIRLLLEGKSNKEISEELFLTIGTTKNYLSQIYMKLNVTDRANAILTLKARRDGSCGS